MSFVLFVVFVLILPPHGGEAATRGLERRLQLARRDGISANEALAAP